MIIFLISNTAIASSFTTNSNNDIVGIKTDTLKLTKNVFYRAEYNYEKDITQTSVAYKVMEDNFLIFYLMRIKEEDNQEFDYDDVFRIKFKHKF